MRSVRASLPDETTASRRPARSVAAIGRVLALAILFLLASQAAAAAASIVWTLSGTSPDSGAAYGGTITVDTSTGAPTAWNVSATQGASTRSYTSSTGRLESSTATSVQFFDSGRRLSLSWSGNWTLSGSTLPLDASSFECQTIVQGTSIVCIQGFTISVSGNLTSAFTPQPALTVTRTANPMVYSGSGQSIALGYTVTNTGNVSVSNLSVLDTAATGLTCGRTSLVGQQSTTCTASYTTTAADVTAGSVTGTATATATPIAGTMTPATATSTVTYGRAQLTAALAVQPSYWSFADDVLSYALTVTNSGNFAVSSIAVADSRMGAITCPAATLAPGASMTCTRQYTVTPADAAAQAALTNTMTVTGVPAAGTLQPASDTKTAAFVVQFAPGVQVNFNPSAFSKAGDRLAFTATVTSNSNVDISNITVSNPPAVQCTPISLTASLSRSEMTRTSTCTGYYVVSQAEVDMATASGATIVAPVSYSLSSQGQTYPLTYYQQITWVLLSEMTVTTVRTPATFSSAGQSIAYEFTVTNSGNQALSSLAVSDSRAGAAACAATSLPAGATTKCTKTYVTTAADASARADLVSTVTATALSPLSSPVSATGSTSVAFTAAPAWTVAATATPATYASAGATIGYSYSLANTGIVALSAITGVDTVAGTITCPQSTLAAGATQTCTAAYTTTAADVTAGRTLAGQATFRATPATGTLSPVTGTLSVAFAASPAMTLTVKPTGVGFSAAGQSIGYMFDITNTGNVTLSALAVSDTRASPVLCPSDPLAVGQTTTCVGIPYTTTAADFAAAAALTDTATARATPAAGTLANVTATGAIPFLAQPMMFIAQTVSSPSFSTVGQLITYQFTLTNKGNVQLSSLQVTDTRVTGITCAATTLAVGAQTICTGSVTITADDVANTIINNSATATAKATAGTLTPAPMNGQIVYVAPVPAMTVATTASPASFASAGQSIAYSFLVTNTGSVAVSALTLTDTKATGISCPVTTLAAGASTTCTGSYTTVAADVTAGSITDTVTANATAAGGVPATATAQGTVSLLAQPQVAATLTVSPPSFTSIGQTLNLTYAITNTGNVPLSNLTVTGGNQSSPVCPQPTLAPGQSTQCTSTYTVTLPDVQAAFWQITAKVLANTPAGTPPAFDYELLLPTKTLLISPAPALQMSVTQNTFTYAAGDAITYTWHVSNTGNMAVTSLNLTDTLGNTISCPSTTLAVAAQVDCTGTYTPSAADSTSGRTISNAATVTGSVAQGTPPSATATAVDVRSTTTHQLTLAVTATPFTGANQSLTYSYVVTRGAFGSPSLTFALTDTRVSNISCPSTSLVSGQSVTCTGTLVATAADVQAGSIATTATATPTLSSGSAATEQTTTTLPLQVTPSWTIARAANPSTFTTTGQSIAYSFLVTNTGSLALSSVAVSDSKAGTASCPATTLAIGASMTCTASYTTTLADVQAGTGIIDTATATGTAAQGTLQPATVTGTVTMTPATSWSATGSMSPSTFTASGQTLTTTAVINNTGNQTITDIAFQSGAFSCPATSLAGGASMSCTRTHTTTAADVTAQTFTQTIMVSASGTLPLLQVLPAPSATYTGVGAVSWTVMGSASPTNFTASGRPIALSFLVTNTGPTAIAGIAVSSASCPSTSLAPGASMTCSRSYTTTSTDVLSGTFLGSTTVSATATATTSGTGTLTPTVSLSYGSSAPQLTVTATPSPATFTAVGQTIAYTYAVTNSGNVAISALSATATRATGISCSATSLAAGASTTCSGTYTTTAADVSAAQSLSDQVTVSGTPASGLLNAASATSLVSVGGTPKLTATAALSPIAFSAAGQTIRYTFDVTNSGTVAVSSLAVSDTRVTGITCAATTLAAGAQTTCSGSYVTKAADVSAGAALGGTYSISATPASGTLAPVTGTLLVAFTASPAMTLAVSTSPTTFNAAGQSIAYSFAVANTGNVAISAIGVSDTRVAGISCPVTTLASGATTTCSGTYVTTSADLNGHAAIADTATVSATPASGTLANVTASASVGFQARPALTLAQVVSPASFSVAGQAISYEFTASNSGNVQLSSLQVTDTRLTGITCPATTLAAGASTTCTGSTTTTAADVSSGAAITNAATATATPAAGTLSNATSSGSVAFSPVTGMTVAVSAQPTSFSTAGQSIAYSFLVTNTGNVALSGLGIADTRVAAVGCPVTSLAAGAATTCTGSTTISAADVTAGGALSNVATASATYSAGNPISATGNASIEFTPVRSWTLAASANPTSYGYSGQIIAFSFDVANTGNTPISGITLSGASLTIGCPASTLTAGARMTCTSSYTIGTTDILAGVTLGSERFAVTATSTTPGLVAASASGTLAYVAAAPKLTVAVTPSLTQFSAAGQSIGYGFLVSNSGNIGVTALAVTDTLAGNAVCPVSSLAPGASTTCTGVHVVTTAEVGAAASLSDRATATGQAVSGSAVTASGIGNVAFQAHPSWSIAASSSPATFSSAGQVIAYTYALANTGNVAISGITLSSTRGTSPSCPSSTLAAGATMICSGSYSVTSANIIAAAALTDTVSASGQPAAGTLANATASSTVAYSAAPTIAVSTTTLPGGTFGTAYASKTLTASGGTGPYRFAATGLPSGMSLTPAGVMSGTPTQAGTFTVSVTATDSTTAANGGPFTSAAKSLTLTIGAPTVAVSTTTLSNGTFGAAYTATTLTASGGIGPYSFAATGLPSGLTLTPAGVLSGSPTQAGTFAVSVTATDATTAANGGPFTSAAKTLTLAIASGTSTISLDASASTVIQGQPILLTATVTPSGVTGTVRFNDGSTALGSATLAAGRATLSTSGLSIGAHSISASYAGDVRYSAATPATIAVSVVAPPAWTISRTTVPSTFGGAGETIATSIVVTSTGGVGISSISITDSRATTVSCPASRLAPGASMTCTGAFVTTAADVAASGITATATARGTADAGTLASISTSSSTSYRPVVGNVVITLATTRDGVFAFTSTLPGVANFTLNATNGTASRAFNNIASGSFTLTEKGRPTLLRPVRFQCNGVSQNTADLAIVVIAGRTTACTLSYTVDADLVRDTAQRTSMAFIQRRAQAVSSAQPNRERILSRLTGSLFGGEQGADASSVGSAAPFGPTVSTSNGGAPLSSLSEDGWSNLNGHRVAPSDGDPLLTARSLGRDEMTAARGSGLRPADVTGSIENGSGNFTAATSYGQLMQAAQAMEASRRAEADTTAGLARTAGVSGQSKPPRFDVWTEIQTAVTQSTFAGTRRSTLTTIGMAGVDWVVNPSFLIGALVAVDWSREQGSPGMGPSTIAGQGWMAGPYAAIRLTPNLVVDAHATAGRSGNKMTGVAGTEDAFTTSRSHLLARLSGFWASGAWRFTPTVAASYYREQQDAFTTSEGIRVAGESMTLGQISFGPEIGYGFKRADGTVFEPILGLKGVWTFAAQGAAATASEPLQIKVDSGLQVRLPSGIALRGSAGIQGIGDAHQRSYNGQASVTVPFN